LSGDIESRPVPRLSLDVLAQHLVTLALGGGFERDAVLREVRRTHSFSTLTDGQFTSVLDFIVRGGAALEHYPDFRRVEIDATGVYRMTDRRAAMRHRLNIGTITSDGSMLVRLLKGGSLGSVEEGFLARLKPGDVFQFAGRSLQLARVQDMTAYVRIAKVRDGRVPKWAGGRMPMSSELGRQVLLTLQRDRHSPEMRYARGLLDLQASLSQLPSPQRSVAESIHTRDGWHLFLYPFAGRVVNEGLAALLALRWGRIQPNTFGYAANDYGLVVSAQARAEMDVASLARLLSPNHVREDLLEGVNLSELSRRQFREVARVAGLLPPSLPGRAPRSMRQLQASSGLLFDVLRQHDPGHMLLEQAQREVMEQQLDVAAIAAALTQLRMTGPDLQHPASLTPFSFPLWAESMRGQLSNEDWKTRIARTAKQLEERNARKLRRRAGR
ncbi:MAG: DNA ligase-associated DEXH box helicase, partial [Thermomonas sp.]